MNKEEFMKELEYLLQDIPEEEKEDALEYYRDYLEEAGEEEEQVLREFGSPERIAAMIRADIAGHLENGGEFTDHGYEDTRFRDPNYQVAKRYELPESCQGNTKKQEIRKMIRIRAELILITREKQKDKRNTVAENCSGRYFTFDRCTRSSGDWRRDCLVS